MVWLEKDGGLPLWVSLPVVNAHQILIHHGWLLEHIKADSQSSWWSHKEVGNFSYGKYKEMYERIGKLLHPELNPDDLTNEVRHQFFVCAGIIDHPFEPGQKLLDMSTLEKMAGRRYVKPKVEDKSRLPEAVLTTGDPHFDLIAQTIKAFGDSTSVVLDMNLDSDALSRLIQYRMELENPVEAKKRKQEEMDQQWWDANEPKQNEILKAAGFGIPNFPKLSPNGQTPPQRSNGAVWGS